MITVNILNSTDSVALSLLDPENGVDYVGDFIGNYDSFTDNEKSDDKIIIDDSDSEHVWGNDSQYFATRETADWWVKVINDQQQLVDRIHELKQEHGHDAVMDALSNEYGKCDLENEAAVCNQVLDEAFGAEA